MSVRVIEESDDHVEYVVTNDKTNCSISVCKVDDGWEVLAHIRERRYPFESYWEPIDFCSTLMEAFEVAHMSLGNDDDF